jgi:hypothetical protein
VIAAGLTCRSATSTPVEMIPERTARLSSRHAGGAARLVATMALRSRTVPSAIPILSAVSGVRSTLMRPVIASRPKRREARRDSQMRLRSTTAPDSTSLNG